MSVSAGGRRCSASSRLFDLNGEANSANKKHSADGTAPARKKTPRVVVPRGVSRAAEGVPTQPAPCGALTRARISAVGPTIVGVVVEHAGSDDTTVLVRLNGISTVQEAGGWGGPYRRCAAPMMLISHVDPLGQTARILRPVLVAVLKRQLPMVVHVFPTVTTPLHVLEPAVAAPVVRQSPAMSAILIKLRSHEDKPARVPHPCMIDQKSIRVLPLGTAAGPPRPELTRARLACLLEHGKGTRSDTPPAGR
jgi:hypothetical protein